MSLQDPLNEAKERRLLQIKKKKKNFKNVRAFSAKFKRKPQYYLEFQQMKLL